MQVNFSCFIDSNVVRMITIFSLQVCTVVTPLPLSDIRKDLILISNGLRGNSEVK